MPDYARIAYEAYVAFHGRLGAQVVPALWQDLPHDEQMAWAAAIDAVLGALRPEDAY